MALAMLTPDGGILIGGVSKRVGPGALANRVARGIRAGGWNAQGLVFVAAIGWVENGTALAVAFAQLDDAKQRQAIAAAALAVRCDPRSYHVWVALLEPWRADRCGGPMR